MVQFIPRQSLPTQDDLPDTDFAPVDSELQIHVPSLLGDSLSFHWRDRPDWFWGINMGVYYELDTPAIVPDGFLSLGVERVSRERGRLSYVLWQEEVVPSLVLEYVSQNYGGEYDRKMDLYTKIGVSYYVIYNPEFAHKRHRQPLEIYQLQAGKYVLLQKGPIWLPEIGLGLGCDRGEYRGMVREWLYWFDARGDRLTAGEELITSEFKRAEKERALRQELLEKLRRRGIDPNSL